MDMHMRSTDVAFTQCGINITAGTLHTDDLKLVTCESCTALEIRHIRESLNLSRRDVEQGTGLSGSAVWRAEQPGRSVYDLTVRTKIFDFLHAVDGGAITVEKKKKKQTKKSSQISDETAKLEAALTAKVAQGEHAVHKLQEVRNAVVTAIEVAQATKRSSKDLKAILELIDA